MRPAALVASFSLFVTVGSLSPVPALAVDSEPRPPDLLPDTPIEATLAGGESHTYRLPTTHGRPLRLTVEQRGIDVVIAILGPEEDAEGDAEGRRLGIADSPLDRRGLEVFLLSPQDVGEGSHQVEVHARFAWAPAGRYRIAATLLPDASLGERARLAAEIADTRAGRAYAEDTAESRPRAADAYLDAALGWRAQGDRSREARAVYCLAVLQRLMDRTREALGTAERALGYWHALGEPFWEAMTLNEIGLAHFHLGEGDAAEERFRQAADLFHRDHESWGEAAARSNLCLSALAAGDLRTGVTCYDGVIERYREVGELPGLAVALANSGRAWNLLGEPERALESYRDALEIRRASEDRRGEAQVLNNLAVLHSSLGEIQRTLTYHRQALEIFEELEDRRWQARILHNLGYAFLLLGDLPRARVHLERALPLRRDLEDPRGEAASLNALAGLHVRQGEVERALPLHRRALALRRETGDRRGEALALILIGRDLGQRTEALAPLRQALDLARELEVRSTEALALQELGRILAIEGESERALEALRRAVELRQAVKDPAGELEALYHLARAEQTVGDLTAAVEHAETAIARIESLRGGVTSPDLRATFLGSHHQVYALAVDLRMELHAAEPDRGHARAAFELSERARARVLLDLLHEVDDTAGAPADLAERLRAAQRRLAVRVRAQMALLDRGPTDAESEQIQRQQAERDVYEALADLEEVEAERRRRNPHYAGLSASDLPLVAEVQGLLGPDTTLVEYALGEERSFLWRITETSFSVSTLPGRQAIESAALEVHRDLSTFDPRGAATETATAAELTATLLGPVTELSGLSRLVVVPDGVLHYLPFAALPLPGSREPMILGHEVIQLPSASVLRENGAEMRRHRRPGSRSHSLPIPSSTPARPASSASRGPGSRPRPSLPCDPRKTSCWPSASRPIERPPCTAPGVVRAFSTSPPTACSTPGTP